MLEQMDRSHNSMMGLGSKSKFGFANDLPMENLMDSGSGQPLGFNEGSGEDMNQIMEFHSKEEVIQVETPEIDFNQYGAVLGMQQELEQKQKKNPRRLLELLKTDESTVYVDDEEEEKFDMDKQIDDIGVQMDRLMGKFKTVPVGDKKKMKFFEKLQSSSEGYMSEESYLSTDDETPIKNQVNSILNASKSVNVNYTKELRVIKEVDNDGIDEMNGMDQPPMEDLD